MARLIDADALMDVIRQHEYRLATKQSSIDYGMFTLGIQQAVDEQPTVDVVEVVHGRWLYVDTDTEHFFLCNRCKKKEYWESNYCPNCGARMDGDDDG